MNNRRFMTKVIARDRLSSCLYQDSCGLVADLSKTCFFLFSMLLFLLHSRGFQHQICFGSSAVAQVDYGDVTGGSGSFREYSTKIQQKGAAFGILTNAQIRKRF
jgi:hypothetical protein